MVNFSIFKFLVMTEKNVFVCKIFQILVYFWCKNCNHSWKKSSPPPRLSQQTPSKNWDSVKLPFLKIWSEAQPSPRRKKSEQKGGMWGWEEVGEGRVHTIEVVGFNNFSGWGPGFWSLPIFFRVLHYTGNNLSRLNQDFIKRFW